MRSFTFAAVVSTLCAVSVAADKLAASGPKGLVQVRRPFLLSAVLASLTRPLAVRDKHPQVDWWNWPLRYLRLQWM